MHGAKTADLSLRSHGGLSGPRPLSDPNALNRQDLRISIKSLCSAPPSASEHANTTDLETSDVVDSEAAADDHEATSLIGVPFLAEANVGSEEMDSEDSQRTISLQGDTGVSDGYCMPGQNPDVDDSTVLAAIDNRPTEGFTSAHDVATSVPNQIVGPPKRTCVEPTGKPSLGSQAKKRKLSDRARPGSDSSSLSSPQVSPPEEMSSPIEYYEIDFRHDASCHSGYLVKKRMGAPDSIQEWTQMPALESHDDQFGNMFRLNDLVEIHIDSEKARKSKFPQALAKLMEIRSFTDADGRHGRHSPTLLFLVAWFNTKQDAKRFPEDWGCTDDSNWPHSKKYVLTTRLQVVESSMTSKVISISAMERAIAVGIVHDVEDNKRLVSTSDIGWKFRASTLIHNLDIPLSCSLAEKLTELTLLRKRRLQLLSMLRVCEAQISLLEKPNDALIHKIL